MINNRKIGLFALTNIVVGNMVGVGAYMIPAALAKYGTFAVVGWIVGSMGAVFLALVFAWLSQWTDAPGGPYVYVRKVFGKFAGYQMAVSYWIMGPVGNAGLIVSPLGYLSTFCPAFASNHWLSASFGLAMIWGFTWLNFFEIKVVSSVQIFGTVLKVAPLILFGVLGIFLFDPHILNQPAIVSDASGGLGALSCVSSAAAVSMWSFIGLESGTVPSDSINNPKKTVFRATIIGVLVVALVYILGCIAIMSIIPQEVLMKSPAPYVDAVTLICGPTSGFVMAVVGIIGLVFSLNGWIFIPGYVARCAAEDGLFPKFFLKTNKNNAPTAGLICGSIIMSIIFLMGYADGFVERVEKIVLLGTYATIVPYLYCAAAMLIGAVKKMDGLDVNPRLAVFVSLLAFLYAIWIVVGSGHEVVYAGSLMLFAITPFYFILHRKLGQKA
ncbi:MAG: amino acid permease [Holosporales bacterium]|jgi:APA family basic amino acid/polyamine antiporter|nr:amino acid permease [Holosporales bacterium]